MNDPKRIDDLEKRFDVFEDEVNHNLTMLLGQTWKNGEQLRMLKSAMIERFDRVDSRVTEAHKELAEQLLDIRDIKKTVQGIAETQEQILDLLKKGNHNEDV
jgi:uncharacterized coiled-coil protein SlyX